MDLGNIFQKGFSSENQMKAFTTTNDEFISTSRFGSVDKWIFGA